jgi:hypothetical protein
VEGASSHLEQTARLIDSLELGAGDFVFLLNENEIGDPLRALDGNSPLREPAWSEEQARLQKALASLKIRGVKILPYTVEKQWT